MPDSTRLALLLTALVACARTAPTAPPPTPPTRGAETDVSIESVGPCVYEGRLRTNAVVYASPGGDRVVARLGGHPFDPDTFVDATVTPPASRGERARIDITAPVPVSGYLAADATPLAVRERLDIVAGHLWLDATFEVAAFAPDGATIEVAAPIPDTQGITVDPPGVFRRVDCADLTLSTMAGFIGPTAGADDPFVVVGATGATVDLYDEPDGTVIARLAGGMSMQVLERSHAWVRLTESEPVHVDGWVQRVVTAPEKPDTGVPGGVYQP